MGYEDSQRQEQRATGVHPFSRRFATFIHSSLWSLVHILLTHPLPRPEAARRAPGCGRSGRERRGIRVGMGTVDRRETAKRKPGRQEPSYGIYYGPTFVALLTSFFLGWLLSYRSGRILSRYTRHLLPTLTHPFILPLPGSPPCGRPKVTGTGGVG